MTNVLIVSNSSEELDALERLLLSRGCTVQKARHGAEALTIAGQSLPDLIVSDVLMPVMDGYYLLMLWKSDPATENVPFVIYTGTWTGASDESLATRLGADAFLVKPISEEDLWAGLEKVLSAPAVATSSIDNAKTFLEHYRSALPRKSGEKTSFTRETIEANGQPLLMTRIDLEEMESELEFRQITEAMPQIVWVTRPDGWHTHFNQRWLDYTGLTLEESLGHGWLAPFHPEEQPEAAVRWAEANATGEPYEIEYRLRSAEGTYRWMLGRALPLRNAEGTIVKWMGTCTDIHDMKEAQSAMREKNAITRIAGRMTGTGGWAIDIESGTVYWSDELSHLLGYPDVSEEQLQGSLSLYLSPWKENLSEAIAQCVSHGTPFDLEAQLRRGDGSTIWVRVTGEAVRGPDGTVTRVHGALQDISQRKEAERALREQASLLDLAQDAILVRDLNHEILYWNQSAERLYGWTFQEARGRSAADLLFEDPSQFVDATMTTLSDDEWSGELEQITRDGRKITVEGHWSLVRDENGEPRSILAINTDITQKKELEQQFLRAQRLDSIGTLATGIAHDFNNLLAPIVMGVSLLRRGDSKDGALSVIDNIERSADKGKQLVRQILSFARGIEGERITLDLGQVVMDTEGMIGSILPKSVTLSTNIDEALWMAQGDPTQITQVLLNLCVNARDAMPDGGQLRLQAKNVMMDQNTADDGRRDADQPFVLIEISDDGIGIPREISDRIFEPFFTTKPLGTGTGLGLSSALGIVKSHGGFINFHSDPGKGTRFSVYLPAQPDAKPAELVSVDPESIADGNGQTVLIVDDEASILNVMAHTLEAHGYRPLTADNGPRALALYEERQDEIDFVITDMVMPVMDGIELINGLRKLNRDVVIIAASGKGSNVEEILGPTEVSAFLRKPYSAEQLLMVLAELCSVPA